MSVKISDQFASFNNSEPSKHMTFAHSFLVAARQKLKEATSISFPCVQYQDDPVGFCRDILGVEPWDKQVEILEAVRDNKRVSVRSGHKVGKSHSAACIVLWYFCSFPDARVVMTSTTSRQVEDILWRELRMVMARAGLCVECKEANKKLSRKDQIRRPCPHSVIIPETPAERSGTGMQSDDFRKVTGATAKQPEAVAGVSGYNLLYIVDEASGVPGIIFEAMQGNMAGGGRMVMFSNPTKCVGEFFDSFNGKKDFYKTIHISSTDTPNYKEGRTIIPGLCERDYVEEKKKEWGENNPQYRVRIAGDFPTHEEGKIFSVGDIMESELRWHEADSDGRLYIGLDPAGARGTGDEIVFFPTRGFKGFPPVYRQGLTPERYVDEILTIIRSLNLDEQPLPLVVVDKLGPIGNEIFYFLKNWIDRTPVAHFELLGVAASDKARREPMIYGTVRDELTESLCRWVLDGGGIPENGKLSAEMHCMEWTSDVSGRLKVTPKDAIKKLLGRSPDTYDALALAVWGRGERGAPAVEMEVDVVERNNRSHTGIDPYRSTGIRY